MELGGQKLRDIGVRYASAHGALLQAECLELLANIKSNSIDVVFADPPFNLGKTYEDARIDDQQADETYREWCHAWLLEAKRVLKPGGALFLYHWPRWLMDLGAWFSERSGIEFRNWIALKMKAGFPIRGRLHPAHYGLLYFTKAGKKPKFNVVRSRTPTCRHCGKLIRDYGGYRHKYTNCEDDGVPWIQVSDFWEDTRPATFDKARDTQINELPLHIPERAILMATEPGDIVLDFFSGSGSTLHAAQRNGRKWIAADFGSSQSALKRIRTLWAEDTEVSDLSGDLASCFDESLIAKLNAQLKVLPRPIASVSPLLSFTGKESRDEARSRIFPPRMEVTGADVIM